MELHKCSLSERVNGDIITASLLFFKMIGICMELKATGGSTNYEDLIQRIVKIAPDFSVRLNSGLLSLSQLGQRSDIKPLLELYLLDAMMS